MSKMMSCQDPLTYLKALLTRDFESRHRSDRPPKGPLVVTLSRDYGAGGEIIGQKLAECLGIPVYDREILSSIARRSKTEEWNVELHDEQVKSAMSAFIYGLISGKPSELALYRRALYDTIHEMARQDGILIGRGAHLLLQGKPVFRLRVVGSLENCARRVADELGIRLKEAEQKVLEINEKRHKAINALYSEHYPECSLDNARNFDLVLNSDRIAPENAIPVVLLALRQAGFDIYQNRPSPAHV